MNDISLANAGSGTIDIGGDLTVRRLGFGAMRITGPGIWGEPPRSRRGQGGAPPGHRAGRQLHRHRRLVRSARERGADRRGPAPVPRRSRDRDQGRARAHRPEPVAVERPPRTPQGGLRRQPAPAPARRRSRCTSCTGPIRTCRTRTRSARWWSSRSRARSATSACRTSPRRSSGPRSPLTPVVSVQNRYNVSDRESESMVDLCEQEDLAFLPYSPIQDYDGNSTVGERGRTAPRHRHAGRPRVAAGAVAGDAADPRHRLGRPRRGERDRVEHPPRPRRGGRAPARGVNPAHRPRSSRECAPRFPGTRARTRVTRRLVT